EGASFCRGCGANISMVPQALTGQMVQPPPMDEIDEGGGRRRRRRKRDGEASLDHSFKNIFMGVAFLIIAIALSTTLMGQTWWFWLLCRAFGWRGIGSAQYIRVREREKRPQLMPPPMGHTFPEQPRPPGELRAPVSSVTEGTTRHLGVEAPTRHLDHD